MQELKKRNLEYEKQQKSKLVNLASGKTPYADIIAYVKNEEALSKKMASFEHVITCFKEDGVYQLNKAITKIVGVAKAKQDSNPSGESEDIKTVDVRLADGTRIKVPYGKIELPDAGEGAHINIAYNSEHNFLYVKGSCQFRFSPIIDEIVDLTRHYLNTESIYQNQAIELDANFRPKIVDLSNIDKEFMILSEKTKQDLKPLMSRIEHPDKCRAKGIPLKTGILMEGPYGTGKTLAAFKIARTAIANNWAFIYLKDPMLLARTLKISKTLDNNGNGIIVFLEDVDQVVRGDRNAAMQDILNTLDGGDTKQMNVIALFTTNHIELIDPTFLRGKRIGSIVSMGALDADTARKFIDYTFKDKYQLEDEGLEEVCRNIEAANIVPAFMAEITEKVKSNMVFEDDDIVKSFMIQNSLESYLQQVELSKKKDYGKTAAEQFAESLVKVITGDSNFKEVVVDRIKNIEDYVTN